TLKDMIPDIVELSKLKSPDDRPIRQAATVALAQLQAPTEDQVAAFQVILDVDRADVESRRVAFQALSLSTSVLPHALTDERDKQAELVLPLFADGLKDTDLTIRQTII